MSVTIKYKGNTIASANTDTTKTIKTSGKYCEADIEVINTPDGGDAPVINPLSVTANGTYTAPSGVDGYSPVTVNVSGGGDVAVGTYKIRHEVVTVESDYSGNVVGFSSLLMGLTSFSDKSFLCFSQKPKSNYAQNEWYYAGRPELHDYFGLAGSYSGYRYRSGVWTPTQFSNAYDCVNVAGSQYDVYAADYVPIV